MEVIKIFDIPKEIINDNQRQRRVYSIEGISPSVLSRSDSAKIMEVKVIGQMDNTIDHTFESANRVYDVGGVAPTMNTCGGGGLQPKIIETKCVGGFGEKKSNNGTQYYQQERVYQMGECSLCLPANLPGGSYNYIADEKVCVDMRGRNQTNPSDRTPGIELEQTLEVNQNGTSNCLTSVQKDNLVMQKVKIKQATKQGYIECEVGGVADFSYPDSKTRRGRVQDNGKTCPTLTAESQDICKIEKVGQISNDGSQYGTVIADNGLSPNLVAGTHGYANSCIATQYRIRKLTPRECWRLMDFSDEDFEKAAEVNSNTQLYKQAGNSIVENVLVAILGQLITGKENVYKELSE